MTCLSVSSWYSRYYDASVKYIIIIIIIIIILLNYSNFVFLCIFADGRRESDM